MGRCKNCGEWFIGYGDLCMWCKMRIEAKEQIRIVRANRRSSRDLD